MLLLLVVLFGSLLDCGAGALGDASVPVLYLWDTLLLGKLPVLLRDVASCSYVAAYVPCDTRWRTPSTPACMFALLSRLWSRGIVVLSFAPGVGVFRGNASNGLRWEMFGSSPRWLAFKLLRCVPFGVLRLLLGIGALFGIWREGVRLALAPAKYPLGI